MQHLLSWERLHKGFKMCIRDSLKGANPQELYDRECLLTGVKIDQLYLYRMIVYYANTPNPDPEKLKWWVWKDLD